MHQLEYVEVNTKKQPDFSVIWLHGLGADGHDFESMVAELQLPEKLGIRFIFPHAPVQPVSINGGYPMRSWFDILGLDKTAKQDEAGIRKSQQSIDSLIQQVIATGINSDKIILGGFSQGGALALHAALRYPEKLAGVIGLSTYLPLSDHIAQEKSVLNQQTPIFLAHGTQDPIVPLAFGEISCTLLKNVGFPVTWSEYVMGHTVCDKEIADLSQWLQQVLSI